MKEQNDAATTVGARRVAISARDELGQTTAEYALVLLAAGTIAMIVITWARGDNSIDELFDLVMTRITNLIE